MSRFVHIYAVRVVVRMEERHTNGLVATAEGPAIMYEPAK